MMNRVNCVLATCLYISFQVQSQDVSTGPVLSWSESNTNLLNGVRDINVVYNESYDPDCIWLFSGDDGSSQVDKNFACYNITSDTIQLRETLHTGGYTGSKPGAIIRKNVIYFWNNDDSTIRTFDFITKESTTPFLTVSQFSNPCMTIHPDGNNLYLLGADNSGGSASTNFYIYNFINQTDYFGPSLINGRRRASCIINQYYNDPYLYVLSGASVFIERLNLNKLDKWEQLTLRLDDIDGGGFSWTGNGNIGYFGIFSIDYYIYILGGYDGGNGDSDEMYYLDVKNWELKYAGTSPLQGWSPAAIYIERTQRAYAFGGTAPSNVFYDYIYYSNKLMVPAVEPTDPVTIEPSNLPSNSPTNKPSNGPTTVPTDDPTHEPTTEPTDDPTGIPTDEPTHQPSDQPTDEPTIEPSDQPTDNPVDINIDDSNENSITPAPVTPAPVETIIDQTSPPTSQNGESNNGGVVTPNPTRSPTPPPVDNGSSNSKKNNNNNNDSNSLLIGVIVVGVLLLCCCIIILCVFILTMGIFTKRRDTDRMRSYYYEREMQNQLFAGENQTLRNQVRIQHNSNNNNNNGARGHGRIKYEQGTELQPIPNLQQQSRILSTSLMSSAINGELNGEMNDVGSDSINNINRNRNNRNNIRKGRIEKEMKNNNDDDLYLVSENNSDLDIDIDNGINGIGGSDLSNINKSVATKINIDGKEVNITYQDLINALQNKKDVNNNDTTMIAGENVDIGSESEV